MLKVCHISTVHPPFDPRIFHRECYSLVKAGYETHLIVCLNSEAEQQIVDGVFLYSLGPMDEKKTGLNAAARLQRFWRALGLSQQVRAEIYHLHDPELIPLGLWLKLRGRKVIFDCHENNTAYVEHKQYLPRPVRFLMKLYITLIEQLAACFFDAILTADQGVAGVFRTRYRAKQVQTVHNFPRLELFSPESRPSVKERPFDLVYHGTIPQYHLETAFAVAEVLRKRGIQARWLFFGSCPVVDWAMQEIERWNLRENFVLIPQLFPAEQVASYVCQAKIGFIPLPDLPKFQHNIPTKLFEFMALGMPVVLSDLPASRPFVGDGKCAIMVPPGDYEAYSDAITSLLTDFQLYQQMSKAGEVRARQVYSWQAEEKYLLQTYESILGGREVE